MDEVSKAALERLLKTLLALGQEKPAVLLSLTQVVQPLLQDEYRVPLLARMFQDAPRLLAALDEAQLRELVARPPADAVALKLLLDLRTLLSLLRALSYLQLAHLSKALAGHAPAQALHALEQLQASLQRWGLATLRSHHDELAHTPVHLERATLLRLEPLLPAELVVLCVQLLKMPYDELEALKLWLEALSHAQLILLVNLLQMELQELLDVRRRVTEGAKQPSAAASLKRTREDREADAAAQHMRHLRLSGSTGDLERERAPKLARLDDEMPRSHQGGGGDPMDFAYDGTGAEDAMELGLDVNLDLGLPDASQGGDGGLAWEDSLQLDAPLDDAGAFLDAPLSLSQMVAPPPPSMMMMHQGDDSHVKPEPLAPPPTPQPFGMMAPSMSSGGSGSGSGGLALPSWQLRIQKQPPAQTVYQRIVKPFPALALVTSGASAAAAAAAQFNLFVEASVIRADSEKELPLCLDGSRVIRIQAGALATYRKLKILATTAQQGCLFRLRFQLKRYEGNQFYTVPGAVCISNPIEVFSHTYYLTNRKKNAPPPPPSVTEVLPARLPAHAAPAQRIVILGAGFVDSAALRVRVGGVVLRPVFHEGKTLIVTLPAALERGAHLVAVANDGKDFCASGVTLTFD